MTPNWWNKDIPGGIRLQKVNQAVKAAGLAVEAGDMTKAVELPEPAVKRLEEIDEPVK